MCISFRGASAALAFGAACCAVQADVMEVVSGGGSDSAIALPDGEVDAAQVRAAADALQAAVEFVSPAGEPPANTAAAVFEKTERNSAAVRRAIWRVTGQGVFEAYVNGVRVGEDFLKPGFTESGKCRHVYSYDITGLLKRGVGDENVFSATVAPGWWCDAMMTSVRETPWQLGRKIAFRGELSLEYADGMQETRGTDKSWRAAYTGPVVSAGIYEGETYDARRKVEGLAPVEINREFCGELREAAAKIALRHDIELKPSQMYVVAGAEGASSNAFGRPSRPSVTGTSSCSRSPTVGLVLQRRIMIRRLDGSSRAGGMRRTVRGAGALRSPRAQRPWSLCPAKRREAHMPLERTT